MKYVRVSKYSKIIVTWDQVVRTVILWGLSLMFQCTTIIIMHGCYSTYGFGLLGLLAFFLMELYWFVYRHNFLLFVRIAQDGFSKNRLSIGKLSPLFRICRLLETGVVWQDLPVRERKYSTILNLSFPFASASMKWRHDRHLLFYLILRSKRKRSFRHKIPFSVPIEWSL